MRRAFEQQTMAFRTNKDWAKGYTLFEVVAGIVIAAVLLLGIAALYALIHFLAKVW
jgi:type II secretory pathway component PulJ